MLLNLIKHRRPDTDKIYFYVKGFNQSINCLFMDNLIENLIKN